MQGRSPVIVFVLLWLIALGSPSAFMERNGARINRLCHYRLVTEPETRYYTVWLTSDDMLAEYQFFRD